MDPHPCLSASLCCAEFETISNFAASYPFPMAKIQDKWILGGQEGNCPFPSPPDFGRIRIYICSIIRPCISEVIFSLITKVEMAELFANVIKKNPFDL